MNEETVTVNKQALMEALQEVERQMLFNTMKLTAYGRRLENLAQELERFFDERGLIDAKRSLLKLLLSEEEQAHLFPDNLMEAWEEEFETPLL